MFDVRNLSFFHDHFAISKFHILTENKQEEILIENINSFVERFLRIYENTGRSFKFLNNTYLEEFFKSEYYKLEGRDFSDFIVNVENFIFNAPIPDDYTFTYKDGIVLIEKKNEIVQSKHDFLTEDMNRHQLKAKNDPHFLKQSERVKALPSTRWVDINKDTLVFRTWSSERSRNHKEYTERIRLVDLFSNLIERKKKLKGKKFDEREVKKVVRESILNGDLEIWCSCPAFLYWGFRFIAKRNHALAKHGLSNWPYAGNSKINDYPVERNPSLKGMYCKHMSLVIDALPFVVARVAKKFTDKYMAKDKK